MSDPAHSHRTRTIGTVLAVVAVAAIVAFALLQSTPTPPAPPLAIAVATPAPVRVASAAPAATPVIVAASSPAPVGSNDQSPAWESTIDGYLRSNVSETQMAQMLINILPTLPEDGQIEAANHIANLLPDSQYSAVKPLLLNSSLPESVLSVFFTDLMNRDDPTKLNSFLDIAQIPNHPFQSEALSDLQIYLGDDYGTDWNQWRTHIAQYLQTANQQ